MFFNRLLIEWFEQDWTDMTMLTRGLSLFQNGFRPFFLGGAVFAVLAIGLWIAVFSDLVSVSASASPMDWHAHEMVFGFFRRHFGRISVDRHPQLDRQPPLSGDGLLGLFAAWVAGRMVMLSFLLSDPSVAATAFTVAVVDLLYPILLLGYAAGQVVHAKAIHNLPVVVMVGLFGIANVLFHIAPLTGFDRRLGPHLGLAVAAILIALIGGRIIPTFTRNWLTARSSPVLPAEFSIVDKIALVLAVAGVLSWAFAPDASYSGFLLALASAAALIRLLRWKGGLTTAEPLVFILHVGYFWLAAALAALAVNALYPSVFPGATALHVLTAGSMGVMILAVMTRASRGHTGRPLIADRGTVAISSWSMWEPSFAWPRHGCQWITPPERPWVECYGAGRSCCSPCFTGRGWWGRDLINPAYRPFDRRYGFNIRSGWSFKNDDVNPQFPRRCQLGVGGAAAAVFGDDGVDAVFRQHPTFIL